LSEKDLIWDEFSSLKRDEVYSFARDKARIRGLSQETKETILDRVRAELAKSDSLAKWDDLTRFVARRGALGKQHVFLYDVDEATSAAWDSVQKAEARLQAAGVPNLLGLDEPVAAPAHIKLATVQYEDGQLVVTAAGRRTITRRNAAEETRLASQVSSGNVVRVYETIQVRAWVRLVWDTTAAIATIQVGQLNRDSDYDEVVAEFLSLVPWVPFADFKPVDLATVIRKLHEQAEEEQLNQTKGETTLQGTNYRTGGLHSNNRALAASQPMLAGHPDIVTAMRLLREHGVASRGNCHWRKHGDGGATGSQALRTPLHTDIAAAKQRVKIMRPVTDDELRYLLGRLRALAQ
jgi:hypothetical protein